ncbi:phosphoribosylformylglycinamidine cyclo-ligase [Candidatus Zixiibacteriota bacterium]
MPTNIDYESSGVSLSAADEAVKRIGALAARTYGGGVLAGVGPFSGLLAIGPNEYTELVLVTSADGVGTKLKLAFMTGRHASVGSDLVNHCVDDIITCGAKPLAFLDYLSMATLEPDVAEDLVRGIADACRENKMSLIGGETAEMPGFYHQGEYDIAGFILGAVEKSEIIDGSQIRPGDMLVGLGSAGAHTNGYSLIRKIVLDVGKMSLDDIPEELGCSIAEALLAPHKSYLNEMIHARNSFEILGVAHITGGGIGGNLSRILPEGCQALIDSTKWDIPPLFRWLQSVGSVTNEEMFRVFNMGIGFILIVRRDDGPQLVELFKDQGTAAYLIGHIAEGPRRVRLVTPG